VSKLVSVESAAELLGTTKNSLMVTASAYKKQRGKYPRWYLSDGKRGANKSWVDLDVLKNNNQVIRSMWMYSTNDFYWVLHHDLGLSETQIARMMSRMSNIFTTVASWVTFLRGNLFSIPPENAYQITADMRTEFFRLSIKIIALSKKEGAFKEFSL
jgi:hypothetical protein